MNEALKDVSLFESLTADDDVKIEDMKALDDTDTGKIIGEKMKEICRWIPHAFAADEDPLWPKHGNTFVGELFEARHIDSDDFILVWRNIAFSYYKRFGRSTYVSRALTDAEATQFLTELRGTLEALSAKKPYDPLSSYRAVPPERAVPLTDQEKKDAAFEIEQVNKQIALLNLNPQYYYSLDERRSLLAEKNNYVANLYPVITLEQLRGLVMILSDENIPVLRAGEFLDVDVIKYELAKFHGMVTNVCINVDGEPKSCKLDDRIEWMVAVPLPLIYAERLQSGALDREAWNAAYRFVFKKEPIKGL